MLSSFYLFCDSQERYPNVKGLKEDDQKHTKLVCGQKFAVFRCIREKRVLVSPRLSVRPKVSTRLSLV
jgi:hypothetical protein